MYADAAEGVPAHHGVWAEEKISTAKEGYEQSWSLTKRGGAYIGHFNPAFTTSRALSASTFRAGAGNAEGGAGARLMGATTVGAT
jgi:hypothetical protein